MYRRTACVMPVASSGFWLRWLPLLLAGVCVMWAAQVGAVTSCKAEGKLGAVGSWVMTKPSGGTVNNGDVIGLLIAEARTKVENQLQGETLTLQRITSMSNVIKEQAVALPHTPGVGLRVRWAGVQMYPVATTQKIVQQPAPGDSVTGSAGSVADIMRIQNNGVSNTTYTVVVQYFLDLVVTDKNLYAGQEVNFKDAGSVFFTMRVDKGGSALPCDGSSFDVLKDIAGIAPPPIVPPKNDSCDIDISYLNQGISLKPSTAGSVAVHGSNRGAGTQGEDGFAFRVKCKKKDTKLYLYFTDTKEPGLTKSYLRTVNKQNNAVQEALGMRIFYSDEWFTPVNFGPMPVNGAFPQDRVAVIVNTPADNYQHVIGFTTQYVRLPGTTASQIKAGDVSAAANVVIMYP